ncbi:F2RL1 [Mytilus edulis]|uniref:F2RL1 n=1 Tax=Mytilus edulis TaxID=6550 RepID=A0A8S3QTK9_MYTED|nr:F2RL1 [Mytilus edulis]
MVLKNTPELRKSRFRKLVINLSISDIIFIVEVIIYIVATEIATDLDIAYKYACLSITNLTAGTYIFSVFQCLLICLERLNATFSVELRIVKGITSIKGIVIGCMLCHLGSVLLTVIEIFLFQNRLTECNTNDQDIKTVFVIPMAFLCMCTIIIYVVIVVRVYKIQISRPGSSSNTMMQQMTIKALKTLSVVSFVTLVGNTPGTFIALYSEFYERSENIIRWTFYTRLLVMINPLLDPFIYVFCLEDFRQQIAKVLCRKRDLQTEP